MSHLTIFEHDDLPAEQFEDLDQQRDTASLGMWTFLATEILFFGVLFTGFFVYRTRWPEDFREGALQLKWYLGALNTAVLLGSSYAMALAVHAASEAHNPKLIRTLVITIALGALFLSIKALEYFLDYREGLIPQLHWLDISPTDRVLRPAHLSLFMTFYFIMTLFHALHMVIGLAILLILIILARRRHFTKDYHHPVEVVGLYWHFVDTVWVFLFPVLYLLRH